jgi:hypothetical protein
VKHLALRCSVPPFHHLRSYAFQAAWFFWHLLSHMAILWITYFWLFSTVAHHQRKCLHPKESERFTTSYWFVKSKTRTRLPQLLRYCKSRAPPTCQPPHLFLHVLNLQVSVPTCTLELHKTNEFFTHLEVTSHNSIRTQADGTWNYVFIEPEMKLCATKTNMDVRHVYWRESLQKHILGTAAEWLQS